jgi:hypothetical protein
VSSWLSLWVEAWGGTRRNGLAMLDSRPLQAFMGARPRALRMSAERPGCQDQRPRCPGRRHGVINVLCHDLPRPAGPANITSVEREASHSCCPGRAHSTTPTGTRRRGAPDASPVFIGCREASVKTRRGSGCRPLRSSTAREIGPSGAYRMADPSVRSSSILHLPAICISVLANVYSGPGMTCGEGSGGVGTQHAGHRNKR